MFKKDYTDEERETYKIMYGDESEWPGANEDSEGRITIDLNFVVAFNEYSENRTTVDIRGGSRFGLRIPYDDFKKLMNALP